ncbi:Anaerobic magnesium-protoporphyrin IX monomethyl ester cyclase [subsurface metagenome]
MKDITLINPVFPSNRIIPPYGLLCLTAILEQSGYSVDLRDYQTYKCKDPWEIGYFLDFLDNSSDVIGFTTYSFNLPFILKALEQLKIDYPEKIIILGGIGVSGVHTELINNFPFIDFIVRGEGDFIILNLLYALEHKKNLEDVNGITFRENSKIKITPNRKRITNLDQLPLPAFHKIDFSQYLMPNIMFSRGCPYECTFCDVAPYWDKKNSKKSIPRFLEEITILNETYSQNKIGIVDDTFVLNEKRVTEFCKALRNENLDIEWGCYGRVDLMNIRIIKEMTESGCIKIYYGIESGNDDVLQKMKKGFSIHQALKVINTSLKYFDQVQTSFVWGFPFESLEQFHDTLFTMMFLAKEGAAIKAVILTPFPHSTLYKEFKHTLKFSEDLSPILYMAGYRDKPEIIQLVKSYREVFPAFYYYESRNIKEKYLICKELGLSAEKIYDIWRRSK